jgi:hypothetical protein
MLDVQTTQPATTGTSYSLDEILGIIDAIPERMFSVPQARLMHEISSRTRGHGAIVEIGTCAGKSTIALAHAQSQKRGVAVHTIDVQEHPEFSANIDRAAVAGFVRRIIGRSSEIARNWNGPIELLFIDGDHRANGVRRDLLSWAKFVVPGGHLAFHDYPGVPGAYGTRETWKPVYRYLMSRPDLWRVVADRPAGSLIIFERLPDPPPRSLRSRVRGWLQTTRDNLRWYREEYLAFALLLQLDASQLAAAVSAFV